MPLYDYDCNSCGHRHEANLNLKNRDLSRDCPECEGVKTCDRDDSGRDSRCSLPPVEF